jgi:PBP1b-binding outer membrane lipoprotein LpoB
MKRMTIFLAGFSMIVTMVSCSSGQAETGPETPARTEKTEKQEVPVIVAAAVADQQKI